MTKQTKSSTPRATAAASRKARSPYPTTNTADAAAIDRDAPWRVTLLLLVAVHHAGLTTGKITPEVAAAVRSNAALRKALGPLAAVVDDGLGLLEDAGRLGCFVRIGTPADEAALRRRYDRFARRFEAVARAPGTAGRIAAMSGMPADQAAMFGAALAPAFARLFGRKRAEAERRAPEKPAARKARAR